MQRTKGDKTQLERELAKIHNARSWASLGSTRLEHGLRDADAALRWWPEEPSLLDTRAHILLELKRYDEALAGFSRAIERGADFPAAFVGRGRTHEAKGNTALAIADYRAALQHNRGSDGDWEQVRLARSRLTALIGGQPN
jgi:tetratricopeptide (TPR) repeat protein